jgi:hypothetical protein
MAHEGVFATSAECIFKMGNGYDSTNVDEDRINELCKQIEGFCCSLARYDFVTNWASLDDYAKYLLSEIESNYVGFFGAGYKADGYGSQREQENIININWARFVQCIGLLKDQNTVTFIKS